MMLMKLPFIIGFYKKKKKKKTIPFNNDKRIGEKRSKERLTTLVATRMTNTKKCHLLILGKSSRPRCSKGVRTLPDDYAVNLKA